MGDSFVAALIGAVVGGLATFLGSLYVGRREVTRTRRAQIYGELLPRLMGHVPDTGWQGRSPQELPPETNRPLLEPIVRAAHIAGRRDGRRVEVLEKENARLADLWDRVPVHTRDGTKNWDTPVGRQYDGKPFLNMLRQYDAWLRGKLS